MTPKDATFRRSSFAITEMFQDQLIALDPDNGICYGLNPVSTRIWQMIEQPSTLDQICTQLTQEYDIGLAECETDTRFFLDEMVNAKLVEIA